MEVNRVPPSNDIKFQRSPMYDFRPVIRQAEQIVKTEYDALNPEPYARKIGRLLIDGCIKTGLAMKHMYKPV